MSRNPLQLDFVVPRRRGRLVGLIVLSISLVLAGGLLFKYREAQQRLHELAASDALLSGARPAPIMSRERLEGEMKSAQATVRQLALPWAELVDSLERSAMREVSVLNIQPDAQQRTMRVTAEARGEAQMLEYLRRVGAAPAFSEVHLVSHQVREDDPQRPLQFSLVAAFRTRP